MFAFLGTFVDTVFSFCSIPWVWVPLGVLTWVGTVYLFAKASAPHEREFHIAVGAVLGVIFGFIAPGIVAFSPIILAFVAIIMVIVLAGAGVAKIMGVDE